MRVRGQLTVACRNVDLARRLEEVLAPDNVSVPQGQRLAMSRAGGTLIFLVDSDTLPPFVSTVLSILTDASLFQEVWLLSRPTGGQDRKS